MNIEELKQRMDSVEKIQESMITNQEILAKTQSELANTQNRVSRYIQKQANTYNFIIVLVVVVAGTIIITSYLDYMQFLNKSFSVY